MRGMIRMQSIRMGMRGIRVEMPEIGVAMRRMWVGM